MNVVPYELLYGYCHCFGKTSYRHGWAASEKEARCWVDRARASRKRPVPAGSDPVWTCPVAGCPGHGQVPWFDYRPIPDKEEKGQP
jgi:hypothetical protein